MAQRRALLWMRSAIAVGGAALLGTGCVFFEVGRQQAEFERFTRISGTVTAERPQGGPLVVGLVRLDLDEPTLVDHWIVANLPERPVPWAFITAPGRYGLAAFEDVDGNRSYDPGEPIQRAVNGPSFELGPGDRKRGIAVVIPRKSPAAFDAPVDVAALEARTHDEQLSRSFGQWLVRGEVVDLSDPRFDPKNARLGLWRPLDFTIQVGPGIYFLEAYDPDRTPVLFVHGISGHPREFTHLVESLDRGRFQPWVFFYPSGMPLDDTAQVLAELVRDLHERHRFGDLFVVAHSMGGLVSREGILEYQALGERRTIRLFVSISTPWAGHAAAAEGVEYAPGVVYSWVDMAPDSDFLRGLFLREDGRRRELPEHVEHHLLFGFVPGKGDDGVVSVSSELRWDAQREARRLYGLAHTHGGILKADETASLLGEILDRRHRTAAAD